MNEHNGLLKKRLAELDEASQKFKFSPPLAIPQAEDFQKMQVAFNALQTAFDEAKQDFPFKTVPYLAFEFGKTLDFYPKDSKGESMPIDDIVELKERIGAWVLKWIDEYVGQ